MKVKLTIYLIIATIQPCSQIIAQGFSKPVIDSFAIKHWVNVDNSKLQVSNDGQYFVYGLSDRPFKTTSIIVQSTSGIWQKKLDGVTDGFFTYDSKEFIYLEGKKLQFLTLSTGEIKTIQHVNNYQSPKLTKGCWLLYQLDNPEGELVVLNISSRKEYRYYNVSTYQFNESFAALILVKNIIQSGNSINVIDWVNFQDGDLGGKEGQSATIFSSNKGLKVVNFAIDYKGEQCSFLVVDSSLNTHNPDLAIWYYQFGKDKAVKVIDNDESKIQTGLELAVNSFTSFTADGRYLILNLRDTTNFQPLKGAVKLDVWSYKDRVLQTSQLLKVKAGQSKRNYKAVIEVNRLVKNIGVNLVRLEQDDEQMFLNLQGLSSDFCISYSPVDTDRFWDREYLFWLVSLKDGTRTLLYKSKNRNSNFWFSPRGRYLILFNDDLNYWCYDLHTGKKHNVSRTVSTSLAIPSPYHQGKGFFVNPGLAGWLGQDEYVILYDEYDIWKVDLSGKRMPENITRGYGRQNKIRISLIEEKRVYQTGDTLVLSLFNSFNKFNGLYLFELGKEQSITKPVMGPWTIYYNTDLIRAATDVFMSLKRPIKAHKSNVWIVNRQSAIEAPNYFITHDFKEYKPLTNLQPQQEYNWLDAELLQWTKPDGNIGQGVLYKPENFDSKKKYPLIIYYYEWLSGRVHQFPTPEFTRSTHINIPWFVSQGYLVFTPDISYTKGKIVESVINTIMSAGKSLSMLPYVNNKRMGISGFSWGGVQTNWLITKTNIFAAAATGGANADPISTALQVWVSRGEKTDNGMEGIENRLDCSLWENKQKWLASSPVLLADKVSMPVLMMNNYGDKFWQQGVELFIALRRLNKKIWMLQYDYGDHGVYGPDGQDAEDFTIRITQFFDCFLKDLPPPRWMSKGIDAKLKGVDRGLEIDKSVHLP